jgi:hypothetical protein
MEQAVIGSIFQSPLSANGTVAIVGAHVNDSNRGSAYIYGLSLNDFSQSWRRRNSPVTASNFAVYKNGNANLTFKTQSIKLPIAKLVSVKISSIYLLDLNKKSKNV